MAVRDADSTLVDRMITIRNDLRTLEGDLRRYGDAEAADVVMRAHREFSLPAFTSKANKAGRPH